MIPRSVSVAVVAFVAVVAAVATTAVVADSLTMLKHTHICIVQSGDDKIVAVPRNVRHTHTHTDKVCVVISYIFTVSTAVVVVVVVIWRLVNVLHFALATCSPYYSDYI